MKLSSTQRLILGMMLRNHEGTFAPGNKFVSACYALERKGLARRMTTVYSSPLYQITNAGRTAMGADQ